MKDILKRKSKTFLLILIVIFTSNIFSIMVYTSKDSDREISIIPNIGLLQLHTVNDWIPNGNSICQANDNQLYPKICSDENGGAIITWEDYRSGGYSDLYAQGFDLVGNLRWGIDGITICTANNTQGAPQICSDEAGGAIITWNDFRSGTEYNIYSQKIDSTGDIKWTANGTAICTENNDQSIPKICSDGAGGAIITWNDFRTGTNFDIYAQRINLTGDTIWSANGTEVCIENEIQYFPQICSDEAGGAIITWEDFRNGNNTDIYAQRINSTGDVKWTIDGLSICTAYQDQWYPQICSDGAGGAIITWEDHRTGTNFDIYAQKIDSTGNLKWTVNGTAICTENYDQLVPQICSDGTGGAIITWEDHRSGTNSDIYAQRINSTGDVMWLTGGVVICTADQDQRAAQICSDNSSGAVITWEDLRGDIYAQSIDANGNSKWKTDGVAICIANGNQWAPQICSDGDNGAIITWFDYRGGLKSDIYAQFTKYALQSPQNGGNPFLILIIVVSVAGGIVISSIIIILLLKKRRKLK